MEGGSSIPPGRLDGWKEISNYLKKGIKTVQRWEKERALPIHRIPECNGSQPHKSGVFAIPEELDAWFSRQAASLGQGEAFPDQDATVVSASGRRAYYFSALVLLGLAVLALAGYGFYLRSYPYGLPANFQMTGNTLLVFDTQGREKWHYAFPAQLDVNWYQSTDNAWHREADFDLDGKTEVLFKYQTQDMFSRSHSLYCFSQTGQVRWVYQNRRRISDQRGPFSEVYWINYFALIPPDRSKPGRVVVSSNHSIEYPEQVVVLDADGKVTGEYWHSGHLIVMAVVQDEADGLPKLFMAGVNNGFRQATLVLLDPHNLRGASSQLTSDPFQLKDMPSGSELAIVRFPRSCISDLYGPFNIATYLAVGPTSIEIVVSEDYGRHGPDVIYQLDRSLKVMAARASGAFKSRHRELEIEGKLHHSLTDQEMEELKRAVVVIR